MKNKIYKSVCFPVGFLDKLSKSTRKELDKVASDFEFETNSNEDKLRELEETAKGERMISLRGCLGLGGGFYPSLSTTGEVIEERGAISKVRGFTIREAPLIDRKEEEAFQNRLDLASYKLIKMGMNNFVNPVSKN